MTKIIYKGKAPRMVAGKFMYTGDVRDVNPKIAAEFVEDVDFVVVSLPAPSALAGTSPKLQEQERNAAREKESDLPFEIVEEPIKKVSRRGKKK